MALYFALHLPHIGSLPIWGYDEGCYLSTAKAIANGEVTLWPGGRDAPMVQTAEDAPSEPPADEPSNPPDDAPPPPPPARHYVAVEGLGNVPPTRLYEAVVAVQPPGGFALGAVAFRAFGSLTAVRVAYVVWCFITVLCVLVIARALLGARWAWLAAGLYIICPLIATHYGQRVFLEPLACAPAYLSMALLVGRHRAQVWALFLAGALAGLAAAIKYPAALVGIGGLVGLLASRSRVRSKRTWGVPLLAGMLLSMGLILGSYLPVPGFIDQTLRFQSTRPYALAGNLVEMRAALRAMPIVLPLGLVGCCWLALKRSGRARILGGAGLVVTVLTCAVAREFYARHLVLALPLLVVGATAALKALWRRPGQQWRVLVVTLVTVTIAASLRPIAGYLIHGERSADQECLIHILAAQPEPVFTLDPIYTLEANRRLPQWRLAYDAFPAFTSGQLQPLELRAIIDTCPTVAMNVRTEHELPDETVAYIRDHYRVIATDPASEATVMARRSHDAPPSAAP